MKKRRGLAGVITLLLLGMIMGCQENLQEEPDAAMQKSGKVIIRITDAPFPSELVSEANVTIDWVKLGMADTEDEVEGDAEEQEGFHLIELNEALTFNLLELSNGVTAVLAEAEIPAGEYNEVRLHITNAGIILEDGSEYDLKIPSGHSSGLKVKVSPNISISGGGVAEILLDFDVSRSFVAKGNYNSKTGKNNIKGFNFKPVVRAVNQSTTGQISGLINDDSETLLENALVALISEGDTISTALTDTDGFYALIGVPAGSYTVAGSKDGYTGQIVEDVLVVAGNITEQHFMLVKEETTTEETTEETGE